MNTIQGKLLSFLEGRESKEMDADTAEYLYLLPASNMHSSLPLSFHHLQFLWPGSLECVHL